MRNSYVSLNSHYYSVPKEYIGDTVELLYDGGIVEIYHKFRHITTHRRDDTPFTYSEKESTNFREYYMNIEVEWMIYTVMHMKSIR